MRLAGRERKSNGAALAISDDAGLGAKAAARVPLSRAAPFFGAPAAFWCALMFVPSRNAMPSATAQPCAASRRRGQTPSLDQRMKVWAAFHHGPNSSGMARHFAPFTCRQMIASIVRRRCLSGVLPFGRHPSSSGSSAAHCSSVSTTITNLPTQQSAGDKHGN